MKILSFIKWHIRKLTLDMALWMVFCFCMSSWATSKNETMFQVAMVLFVYGFCKLTWYFVKESYEKFEKEQQELFDKIKHSDVK
jgi:Ca2+/Na+ antiporter